MKLPQNKSNIGDLFPGYRDYCEVEKENCPDTIYDYSRIFAKIVDYTKNISAFKIDQFVVTDIKKRLLDEGFSDAYRAKVMSVLKNFLIYLSDYVGLKVFDYSRIKIPKVKTKPVDYMVEADVDRFIVMLPEEKLKDLRFKTLVAVLADTGARISEILGILRSEFNYQECEVTVRGKGGRYRKIYLGQRAMHFINKYN